MKSNNSKWTVMFITATDTIYLQLWLIKWIPIKLLSIKKNYHFFCWTETMSPSGPSYRREYRRQPSSNFTYVSPCVKYLIFLLNFIFWVNIFGIYSYFSKWCFQLFGGLLIGIGLYAFVDKWQLTGWVKLENVYDVILNISLVMVIMGGVVFIVSFAGCVGALRENTCLLKFVSFFVRY